MGSACSLTPCWPDSRRIDRPGCANDSTGCDSLARDRIIDARSRWPLLADSSSPRRAAYSGGSAFARSAVKYGGTQGLDYGRRVAGRRCELTPDTPRAQSLACWPTTRCSGRGPGTSMAALAADLGVRPTPGLPVDHVTSPTHVSSAGEVRVERRQGHAEPESPWRLLRRCLDRLRGPSGRHHR